MNSLLKHGWPVLHKPIKYLDKAVPAEGRAPEGGQSKEAGLEYRSNAPTHYLGARFEGLSFP